MNDTEARSLRLGVGLLLAYLRYPVMRSDAQRARVPSFDFAAFACLVPGLGVPTTANYVLVATLSMPTATTCALQRCAQRSRARRGPAR